MMDAVRRIGEYFIERESLIKEGVFAQTPRGDYKDVLVITFKEGRDGFDFLRVDVHKFTPEAPERWLYRKPSGSRASYNAPTVLCSGDVEKALDKLREWFRNSVNIEELSPGERDFLKNILRSLEENRQCIADNIREKDMAKSLISIGIEEDGLTKAPGEIELFRRIFLANVEGDFYRAYKTEARGDGICSLCGESKEVYGFVRTYKFYNMDKPGFVAGGFRQENAWKNFPVCEGCAVALEAGKKFVDEKFNFNLCGINYYLIPKLIRRGDIGEIIEVIEEWEEKQGMEELQRTKDDEGVILEIVSEQRDFFNVNFLFYKEEQGALRILMYADGVLPSRLKKIFDAKKDVEREIRAEWGERPGNIPSINFGTISKFMREDWRKKRANELSIKRFLDVVGRILMDRAVDYDQMIKSIIARLRAEFVQDKNVSWSAIEAWMMLNFLKKLGVLEGVERGGAVMNYLYQEDEFAGRIEEFFERHGDFFSLPERRAAFLMGMLVESLLRLQAYERGGATPFRKKLKGLKLGQKTLQNLLPEVMEKFEQYGKHPSYARKLEEMCASYFVAAGDEWRISDKETSFYFALGMALQQVFKPEWEETEGEEE